jgi:hypothetical protein
LPGDLDIEGHLTSLGRVKRGRQAQGFSYEVLFLAEFRFDGVGVGIVRVFRPGKPDFADVEALENVLGM